MEDLIRHAIDRGATFAEIRSSAVSRTSLALSSGKITDMSAGTNRGFSVRVLFNERWGNSFSDTLSKKTIDTAIKNASATHTKTEIDLLPGKKSRTKTRFRINPKDISFEEKRDMLLSMRTDNVKTALNYSDASKTLVYLNSEGSKFEWEDVLCHFSATAYAHKGERVESFYDVVAHHGGYELADRFGDTRDKVIKTVGELLDARAIKGGEFPTVIDPLLAGVFAHECIGHACEADLIKTSTSILKGKMGSVIGPEHLSIADDGSIRELGWIPFDHEGIPGKRNVLVDNGRLISLLHTRETAKEFQVMPTGNGRQQDIDNKIIPRMTNTFILPGDQQDDEVFDIKQGYYLKSSAGGQVDPSSGEFLFNAMEAFKIQDGEVAERIRSASLSGNILDSLHDIEAAGKSLDFGVGYCGKSGQYVPVGTGGPHVRFGKVMIGGQDR